jgi:aldehyde:ferredoxin oxidoreductase
MSVKGLELPAYDPRGMKGQGLAYATSSRGGCHLRANMLGPEILGVPKMIDRFATLGKAGLLINMQNLNAVLDSLSLCKFTGFAMKEDYYARLLSAVWGEPMEPQELLRIGERIWNLERLFNLAAGFGRADDTLPARLLHEPVAAGPARGQVVDLPPMLDEYYVSRGWDDAGVPAAAKLAALGLADAISVADLDMGRGAKAGVPAAGAA